MIIFNQNCVTGGATSLNLWKDVCKTPKRVTEIAGEGIEYNLVVSKSFYHRQPLQSKKGDKECFIDLVKQSLSDEVLTREAVQKCAKRARAYLCAYFVLESTEDETGIKIDGSQISLAQIEKMQKTFLIHCSALDFDSSVVDSIHSEHA
jgi:hypothetical protein